MEAALEHFFAGIHWTLLGLAIAFPLAVLGKSAGWLVDEAVGLSESLKIPQMVVGATIVSLGTTAPEAAVCVLAAIEGAPGLALGNAFGSNITNIALILGVTAVISPITVGSSVLRRELPLLFMITVIVAAVFYYDAKLDRTVGFAGDNLYSFLFCGQSG